MTTRDSATSRRQSGLLGLAFGLLDRQFGALESNSAVGTIAEGFVDRTTATAEREGSLAGEIVRIAIRIHQFD